MHTGAMAELFAVLMDEVLGYHRFGAQGGDWGSAIVSRLGYRHPDTVIGVHVNLVMLWPYLGPGTPPLSEAEQKYLVAVGRSGYGAIQATKPQSWAYGLTDSPAGPAAWVVEKFRAWSDCDGDVERVFTKDELLTNVMIYWVTGSIGSSHASVL
jgi:epoxide hydrolase